MRDWNIYLALALFMLPSCDDVARADTGLFTALERLADEQNAEAIYHLGMAYHTGSGVSEDRSKALEAFRRSAALGDPLASYKLGCYYDGQGGRLVGDDPDSALRYKLVAAEAGYALAQQDVAAIYASRGDLKSGLTWLKKAADQGWSGALMTYASVHNGAAGVPRDAAKTAAYFKLFLDRAEPDAEQREWLANFERKMQPDELERASSMVRTYRAAPTALTIKALSGQQAAQELVRQGR